ncbi:pleckstrin homology domain-containing family J member 1 isoform X1 [Malaclemys terrapin pileata]|uniref:pleckstrin homology domain-containing family J member 1 isoform X1 n=1 Tax=Malaclemys terrapin pileata TaxID=2991368 RepID=UPI0023A8DBD8|nr:pleckstrin homology domain-containing family J member 1 isoform X1 [Malaclemys terrapin pileata]
MRYSERELLSLSRQPAEKAAEILMRVPKKGSVLKKRLVKLVVNFLFYFRTDEAEPIGALLLEHCKITKEEENVFSISFIEEPDRKYFFECDTEEQCQEWIEALRRASYEFMRRSLIFYRNEIQKMTGKLGVKSIAQVDTLSNSERIQESCRPPALATGERTEGDLCTRAVEDSEGNPPLKCKERGEKTVC